MRSHQPLECIRFVKLWIQPEIKLLRAQHQWNALGVDVTKLRVRWQRDDSERVHLLIAKMPGLP